MSEQVGAPPPVLHVDGVTAGYGTRPVLRDVSLKLAPGRITSVIGPNGSGKSTLFRVLANLLRPMQGRACLDGLALSTMRPRRVARHLALLPQSPVAPEGITVGDLAARGRQPHQPWFRQWSREDERITGEALMATDMADLADRPVDELSGGQRQRAWMAMTLAQQTPVLLLDEPTTHLDLAHAVEVLDLVVRLRREERKTVVMVLHDLNLAARYSDELVVVGNGQVVTTGTPHEVVTASMLRSVFALEAHVVTDPHSGFPVVVPASHG